MGCFGLNQGKAKGSFRHFQPHIRAVIRHSGYLGQRTGTGIPAAPDPAVLRHFECQLIGGHLAAHNLCRIHDRIHQWFVSGTPAGIAMFLEPVPDVLTGRVLVGVQKGLGRHDESGHAPHCPCPQPTLVPVSFNCSRRISDRNESGSTTSICVFPLMFRFFLIMPIRHVWVRTISNDCIAFQIRILGALSVGNRGHWLVVGG